MRKTYILIIACLFSTALQAQKIHLSAANVINISAIADANTLVDEQVLAGNPKMGATGTPHTAFNNGYQNAAIYYPLEVIIDLYGIYALTDIYFFDSNNSDSLIICTGSIGAWVPIVKTVTDSYQSWRAFTVNKSSRYLKFLFNSPATIINEIILYGALSGNVIKPITPTPIPMKHPLMENFIGMNSFHDVPDSIQQVVQQIREYHNWSWDEGNGTTYAGFPNNTYGWNPSWVSGAGWGWNFDEVYQRSASKGFTIQPDLKECAQYMFGNNAAMNEAKPVRNGKNPELPSSYPEHSDYLFQFAARYGSIAHPATVLKLRADNPVKSGLGYIKYIENWNEQDKNWIDRASYFKPFEFAAMSSADFDGHLGTMGKTYGIKNADPSIKFVMGGLVNTDTLYIKSMLFWSQLQRNGSFPADILNFHHYSGNGNQTQVQSEGISPEEDHLKEKIATIVDFKNKNLPGKEVWLSEFGYDTNPGSIQAAPVIGEQNNWETQARWLVRAYLAIVAGGADRAHMYMSRDVNGSKAGRFGSSGLVTSVNNDGISAPYTKKNSWYYIYTFRKLLTGYRFKEEVSSGNPSVFLYKFQKESYPDSVIYAAWSPTSRDLTVKSYTLQLPNALEVSKVELAIFDTSGIKTSLSLNNHSVIVDLSEKPDFFIVKMKPTLTGTELKIEEKVQIFPNPCSDSFTITFEKNQNNISLSLTDIRGVVLKTESVQGFKKELFVSHLSAGLYFLHIEMPLGKQVIKIVKN